MKIKPSNDLILAWAAMQMQFRQAHRKRAWAQAMFRSIEGRIVPHTYKRADALTKLAVRIEERAMLDFKAALRARYADRFEITLRGDKQGAIVEVWEPHGRRVQLRFNSALRLSKTTNTGLDSNRKGSIMRTVNRA